MNFVDKFINKISDQMRLTILGMRNAQLSNEDAEHLEKLQETDYEIMMGFLAPYQTKKVDEKIKPVFELLDKTIGATFHDQIMVLNELNQHLLDTDIKDDEKASILYYFYLSGQVPFFHLVSPINLHPGSVILFNAHVPHRLEMTPNFNYEDIFTPHAIFDKEDLDSNKPLEVALEVIRSEKSVTELMKFLEFVFAVETLERIASTMTYDEIITLRKHHRGASDYDRSTDYRDYQRTASLQLLNEIVYLLEDKK